MKRMTFLLFFLCVSPLALAKNLMFVNNSAGGQIVFTNNTSSACKVGAHRVIGRASSGHTILGCWSADSELIYVLWDDGDKFTYPWSSMIPITDADNSATTQEI